MRLGVAAALAAALLLSGAPTWGQEDSLSVTEALDLRPGETLLQVSSVGTSEARPSIAVIEAGVVSVGTTALESLEANSAEMTAVIAAVRSLGVAADDIQTRELRVQPRIAGRPDEDDLAESSAPPRILGYVARNIVEVRLRALDRAPQLVGALFAAGANTVDGPSFELDDETSEDAFLRARVEATANAQAQADSYARAFGMRVERILRIDARFPESYPAELAALDMAEPYAPIEAGEVEITVRLSVDYALVPR